MGKTVVIFDKNTREVLACIPTDGQDGICRNDLGFEIYDGTEPAFREADNKLMLSDRTFFIKL